LIFQIVVIAFHRQRLGARAEIHARRFEAIEQTAGFFADVVDPFTEVGARRTVAVTFEPEEMRVSGFAQRQE
jgi:hypothetical protein